MWHKISGIPEGNGPSGKPRNRWEGNIKMYLMEIGWEDVNCINFSRAVGSCENVLVHKRRDIF